MIPAITVAYEARATARAFSCRRTTRPAKPRPQPETAAREDPSGTEAPASTGPAFHQVYFTV